MADQIQEIKNRLNIADVVSGYLRLQKAGANFRALCPFHNEKTPSFMVSPSRQSWHCFGCGEGGDIFTFVEKIENTEFRDALKMLAEKAGLKLEYSNPKVRSEKDRLYEICELAAEFFTTSLNYANTRINTNETNKNLIIDYLRQRGLKDETISEWRLGYAPDSWNSLLNFLTARGYGESEIEKAGLVVKTAGAARQASRFYDRFRNRLMFPIFDINGRTVAFSGRIMSGVIASKTEKEGSGKYVNSPETLLYGKRRVLYGLNKAKNEIRKADKAILAEGQLDAILPWQDGVKNIVATSGTALTEEQLLILKRLTDNLILAFDMDEAGFRATKRGIDLAAERGFNISIVSLTEGKDPADFVKENPGVFVKLADSPQPIMNYYFESAFKKFDGTKLEGKKFIALNLLSEIKRLPSAIEKSHFIRELSLKLDVSETDLKEEMEQLESRTYADSARINADDFQRESAPNRREPASKSRKEILSERLLALLLKKAEPVFAAARAAAFMPAKDTELLTAISLNSGDFSKIRSATLPDSRSRLDFLYMLGDWEIGKAGPDFDLGKEINFLIGEIEREHYRETLAQIGLKIKKCEAEGAETDILTKEFQSISKKLYQLK